MKACDLVNDIINRKMVLIKIISKEILEVIGKDKDFKVKYVGISGSFPDLHWFTIYHCNGHVNVYVRKEEFE